MAIFSYTTGSDSHRISLYANETISNYSSVLLSDLTFVGDPEFKLSSYSEELEEQRAYSYNESALVNFESEDYGLINEIFSYSDDFGLITDQITSEKQKFDYGTITILISNIPFGKLSISTEFADVSLVRRSVGGITFLIQGKGKIYVLPIHVGSGRIRGLGESQNSRVAYQSGSGKLFGFSGAVYATTNAPSRGNYSSTGTFSAFTGAGLSRVIITKAETNIFRFSGSAIEKNAENYVGSGNLFGFVGHAERVTYDYNESSVVRPEGIDYGFITNAYSDDDDYGLISEIVSPQKPWNNINYGFIIDDSTRIPFGKLKLDSLTRVNQSPSIFGTDGISITGNARIFVLPIHKGSGQFVLGGSAEPKASLLQVGSGSLFAFTGSAESIGAKQESTNLFRFSGSAKDSIAPAPHVGSGRIFGFTGAALSRVIITKAEPNIFRFSGSALEKNTENYIGSGSLFGFVGHAERVTYDYNESSVVTIDGLDYGFVSDIHTSDDDYGLISEIVSPQKPWNNINYGFITETDNIFPFGKLKLSSETGIVQSPLITGAIEISITGNARIFVLPIHKGSGQFVLGGSAEPKASLSQIGSGSLFAFTGSAESIGAKQESTNLFRFSGSSNEAIAPAPHIGSGRIFAFTGSAESKVSRPSTTGLFKFTGSAVDKHIQSYVASGNLFGFVGHAEKVTYDYNESSIVTIDGLDYGFVSENYTSDDDYGYITQPTNYGNQKANYGYITDNVNRFPYGVLRFSTTDTARIQAALSHVGNGFVRVVSGPPTEVRSFGYAGDGTINLTGRSTARIRFSLTHVGSGSLFAFTGGAEAVVPTIPPGSGLFRFTGSAVERNTESYVGSGSLFAFTGATFTSAAKENPQGLFKIYGTAIPKATLGHVGFGSLFISVKGQEATVPAPEIGSGTFKFTGSAVERNTESYVGSGRIFAFTGATEVSSNAPSTTGLFKFLGSVFESVVPAPHIGSGSLFTFISSTESTSNVEEKTVLFKFTGSAVERNTESYVGSGSLFAFTGATEVSSNAPSTTGLFKFFGSAVEKNTESYVGSGTLFTFDSSTESSSISSVTTGLFKFTGSAVEKNTESYAGSGTLFTFDSSTSVFAGTLSVEGALFKFGGAASIGFTLTEVGRGSFNLRQKVSGLDSRDKQRYISGIERTTSIPEIKGALFRATGVVTLFFQYTETGSGSITLAGNARTQTKPVHVGEGTLNVLGSAETPRTRPYIGSGSLFGLNSSTTVAISRPPVRGALFTFTGSAVEKNTESYIGSTEAKLSGTANIISRLKHIGSGKTTIFGSAVEKNTESYVGSGRIFGFTGAAESIGRKLPEFKTLFKITGSGSVANSYGYAGSGSLFAIVSKTESTSSVETKTSLFKFSGSASERNTESYIGSGIVRFRTKDSILDINGKIIFISATESSTVVPPTRTQLFKFGGLARTERNTNWTTTGTLFGFGGGAERVSFTPAKSTVLFEFVGNAEERKTKSYSGSGSIFAFIGTSDSSAVVSSAGGLFKITGSAKESVLPATYVGSGSLFAIVSKTESVTFSPPTTNLFKFTGSAVEKNTESYVGSGRIFGFQSAGIARVVPYDRTQILFRLLGTLRESFNKSGYIGNTQVQFIGNSSDKYVEYDSPKPTRIYII
jgi:hypothetical protein